MQQAVDEPQGRQEQQKRKGASYSKGSGGLHHYKLFKNATAARNSACILDIKCPPTGMLADRHALLYSPYDS